MELIIIMIYLLKLCATLRSAAIFLEANLGFH